MTSPINGFVGTFPVSNPLFKGGYVFSQAQASGVVAANNFLALRNPAGSGRTLVVIGVFLSSTVVADIGVSVDPMRGWIATNITGGVVEAAASIGKVRSTMPNPTGQIVTGNPSATLGASWFNSPPLIGASKASAPFVHQVPASTPAGFLTLLAGEGTVIRTESGDVDQRWNISIVWGEF